MKLPPYDLYPEIKGETIVLRQVSRSDLPDLLEISFYDGKKAGSIQEAMEMLACIEADYQNGASIHWGLVDPTTQEIVGTCGYYRGFENGVGELGCILRPQYQRKGYMKKGLELAIQFGQKDLGLNQITATTSRENTRAIKLLEGLGFDKKTDLNDLMTQYELQGQFIQKDMLGQYPTLLS